MATNSHIKLAKVNLGLETSNMQSYPMSLASLHPLSTTGGAKKKD